MTGRWRARLCAATLVLISACSGHSNVKVPQVSASIANGAAAALPSKSDPSALPPVPQGDTVHVDLVLLDRTWQIAPGVNYRAWTFNGTVPGPVVHARVGQTIDFHSALAPPNIAYQTIAPGQTIRFSWVARYPGVFLYHCGTPPVLMHISNGMYGAVLVDPENGWPDGVMTSYVLLQSEFYTQSVPNHPGLYEGNMTKAREALPDYVDFNGTAMQYVGNPLPIRVNQPVRLFVVNAAGNPENVLHGLQTVPIAPGDGAMMEFTVQQAGRYPFVTHSFGDADLGAMGAFIAR